MPTWEFLDGFRHDLKSLTPEQRHEFRRAVEHFVTDLRAGRLRKGLRVKKVQGHPHVWELTWANDGRATFRYGPEVRPGMQHIVWRRVGSHDIFNRP